MKDVYLQLYSLYGEIDRDYRGALRRAKEAGYAGVEFAQSNYGGMTPQELYDIYMEKNRENFNRQLGLSSKPGYKAPED